MSATLAPTPAAGAPPKHIRPSTRKAGRAYRTSVYVILTVISVGSVLPLFIMLNGALRDNNAILNDPSGLPVPPTFASFVELFKLGQFTNFLNSIFIAGSVTVVAVLFCGAAGYAFTKLWFPGANVIFVILLAAVMIPPQTAIPGFYDLYSSLGWINTYRIQILPFIGPVFGLFLVRQYMADMPTSLLEAARLDGAGEFRIYSTIVFPLQLPVLGALSTLLFLGTWNEYLWPSVFASGGAATPFSVSLANLRDPILGVIPLYAPTLAGCLLASVPLIVVFFLFQKQFMASAVYSGS